jgi:hypothetical protein
MDVWLPVLHAPPPQTHTDFYFWGCLKEKFYATEVQDHDNLLNCIEVVAADIRNMLRKLVTVRGSLQCHCEECAQEDRGHSLNICCDVRSVCRKIPSTLTKYTQKEVLLGNNLAMLQRTSFSSVL